MAHTHICNRNQTDYPQIPLATGSQVSYADPLKSNLVPKQKVVPKNQRSNDIPTSNFSHLEGTIDNLVHTIKSFTINMTNLV